MDDLGREMVRSIEQMTQRLVEFRQEVGRAVYPLYPRILEIEKRLDQEARDRPQRQQELDARLTVQDTALAAIKRRQGWRLAIEAVLAVAAVIIAGALLYGLFV